MAYTESPKIPFWKLRCKHGRDKIFSTPEILWDSACGYFEWVEANPLMETKAFAFQGVVTQEQVPKMRAMTINGLCLYLSVGETTLLDYGKREDFSRVVELIKKTIYEQKFTGAAADLLNANIIARDLGLRDKTDVDHSSKDGSMSPAFDEDKYKAAQDKMKELD